MSTDLEVIVRSCLSQPGRILSETKVLPWSMLTLYVCEASGGDCKNAMPAAAAIEMWLAAGDVFDDVEDRDSGICLLNGEPKAVNAGTTLLFLTQVSLLRLRGRGFSDKIALRAAGEICRAGVHACDGQHQDLDFESRLDVNDRGYLSMTSLRSGSLVACACRIGALLGTRKESLVKKFGAVGHDLGIYGQIINDVRSLDPAHGNKTDIARRKKTFPIIYGIEQAEGKDRALLRRALVGREKVSPELESEVRHTLERLGAFQYSLIIADMYLQRALTALDQISVSASAAAKIKALVAG